MTDRARRLAFVHALAEEVGAWKRLIPSEEMAENMRLRVPLRRFGVHDELTNLAAFLMSDLASYMTGQNVVLDGGEVLNAGGQFNDFTKMDREGILTMFEMMRPSKKEPGGGRE